MTSLNSLQHNTHNQPSPAIKYDYDMEIHDWRVLVVVAGRHRCAARRWMIEAQADIYLPACVTAACVVHHQSTSSPVVSISIVGDNSGSISHAKSLISATLRAFEANGGGFAQTVTIPHRKIEYIYRYQLSALEEIMRKYGKTVTVGLFMTYRSSFDLDQPLPSRFTCHTSKMFTCSARIGHASIAPLKA